jgi:hypothetical protein
MVPWQNLQVTRRNLQPTVLLGKSKNLPAKQSARLRQCAGMVRAWPLGTLMLVGLCAWPVEWAWAGSGSDQAADDGPPQLMRPRIFNGTPTFDYPFVGVLIEKDGAAWRSRCSVSLIGPRAALTAAHCLCDAVGSTCQPGQLYAPRLGQMRVLMPQAGILDIAAAAIPTAFAFPDHDYAVIELQNPVRGIAPVELATEMPAFGTPAEIIGYGSTTSTGVETGIQRVGDVTTGSCDNGISDDDFVCWIGDGGISANTCPGDSGAPLLVEDAQGRQVLAGVASGGYGACDGDDLAFNTAVAPIRGFLEALTAGTPSTATGGERVTNRQGLQGSLSSLSPTRLFSIEVPDRASRLVAVGNAIDATGNDYRIRLSHESVPGMGSDTCVSDEPGVFQSCIVEFPHAGTWYASYDHQAGPGGEFQLSLTAFEQDCRLDVDGDQRFDALTDGMLAWRHLAGYTGPALVDAILSDTATRTAAAAIVQYLDKPTCANALDIDLDGERRPETDGMLVLRRLFGFAGSSLIDGVLSPTATRTDPDQIATVLDELTR